MEKSRQHLVPTTVQSGYGYKSLIRAIKSTLLLSQLKPLRRAAEASAKLLPGYNGAVTLQTPAIANGCSNEEHPSILRERQFFAYLFPEAKAERAGLLC